MQFFPSWHDDDYDVENINVKKKIPEYHQLFQLHLRDEKTAKSHFHFKSLNLRRHNRFRRVHLS